MGVDIRGPVTMMEPNYKKKIIAVKQGLVFRLTWRVILLLHIYYSWAGAELGMVGPGRGSVGGGGGSVGRIVLSTH